MPARILIVDDEERLLRLYSTVLKREGHEVLTASTAQEAFELASSAQPDLVLMDVMMPLADGIDAFVHLAAAPATQHLRVIFLTSLIQEAEVDEAGGRIGGRDYISKSAPLVKFTARVNQVLFPLQRSKPPS